MQTEIADRTSASAHPEQRIDYVDGLRALAVLGVVVAHVFSRFGTAGLGHVAAEGARGVDLFFVLSGFCLAYPTLLKIRRLGTTRFDIVGYGAKRLVRIIPPFYLASAAFVVLLIAVPLIRHSSRALPWTVSDIVGSLVFLDGNVVLLSSSFWTLMVEFRWYFAFPVLLAVWIAAPRAFLAIGALSVVLYNFTRARGLDLGTLPGFMLGIIAADLYVCGRAVDPWLARVRRWSFPLAVVFAAVGVASEPSAKIPALDPYGANVQFPFQPTVLGWQLAMFFFVLAAGEFAWVRRLLSIRPLLALGTASYSIYLVHQPIVDAVEANIHASWAIAAGAVVALACGFAFWAIAERPFTTGNLRKPLLEPTLRFMGWAFGSLSIIRTIELRAKSGAAITEVESAANAAAVLRPAASGSSLRSSAESA